MTRPARVQIDTHALRHNLALARARAKHARIMAVIKANAYGHGYLTAAKALDSSDAFAVASLSEALYLRQHQIEKPLLVFQGAQSLQDYRLARQHRLILTIHRLPQIDLLEQLPKPWPDTWLKIDTGMGRMGIHPQHADQAAARLGNSCQALMSHLACADQPEHPLNTKQLETFERITRNLNLPTSLYNSAALLDDRFQLTTDWVRPGLMLYGASPLIGQTAAELGLRPAMKLQAPLLDICHHNAGDTIGYGATWQCPEPMPVGIIAIGYADGYPRHAPSGTPVQINGATCPLIGRVSMDSITVDLRPCSDAQAGDLATLWGPGLPVEHIATRAETIPYELLCHAGQQETARS